jgi:LysM repeat protein
MYMNEQLMSRSTAFTSPRQVVFRTSPHKKLMRIIGLAIAAVIILVISLTISLLSGDQNAFAATSDSSVKHSYEVELGDTLWNIASTHVHKGQDVREYINEVKKVNGLTNSILHEGQVINLP